MFIFNVTPIKRRLKSVIVLGTIILPTFTSGIIQVKRFLWRYVLYHREVHEAFMAGKFVVQRGDKKSSVMALDQSQEHSIQFLKEDSGAKGLCGQQES